MNRCIDIYMSQNYIGASLLFDSVRHEDCEMKIRNIEFQRRVCTDACSFQGFDLFEVTTVTERRNVCSGKKLDRWAEGRVEKTEWLNFKSGKHDREQRTR